MEAHEVRLLCHCPVCGKLGDERAMVKVGQHVGRQIGLSAPYGLRHTLKRRRRGQACPAAFRAP
jgi:hypothetical protein